ncbi:hypothetical protein BDZ89DRAFT_947716 [Hymenopellis radicata]|nr:hypothetical protein BDZ89DRAFT_947716 [Hymenopellis radicata]
MQSPFGKLACVFCRRRKIACGPPDPEVSDNACDQCQKRSLKCEFVSEKRRGARKMGHSKGKEREVSC